MASVASSGLEPYAVDAAQPSASHRPQATVHPWACPNSPNPLPALSSFISYSLQDVAAGLLALLGLLVPLAIHLWNRRPGRTVQVGSVRWLAAAANRRLRNLRLEQVWLLLLRAAVLALLALAVAQPLRRQSLLQEPVRGQVLLAPEVLRPDVLSALRPSLDSLRRRGYALRLFAPGFRVVSSQAWASPDSLARLAIAPSQPAQTGKAAQTPVSPLPDDYWARAQQATDSFPDQPIRVVSGAARRHFTGPRPTLPTQLTWQTVPLPDSVVWLAAAAVSKPGTLRLLVGRSGEDATTFRTVQQALPSSTAPLNVAGLPELHYQPAQANQPATVQQPGRTGVPVLANPLRVVLYADASHTESARYVRAALQAAAIGLAQRLEITAGSPNATAAGTTPDWLFWLSSSPAPAGWQAQVQQGAKLWQEAAGAGSKVETELNLTGLATAPPIAISRMDTTATTATKGPKLVVWQDGTGRALLTRQPSGTGSFYHLATRLQPTWSGLPDSPALPELFLQLLRPASAQPDASAPTDDLRQLDARQLATSVDLPVASTAQASKPLVSPSSAIRQATSTTDLRPWAVLAALLLFGVERWLASRRTSVTSTSSL
ncbi:BatA domain-containing protein [Hymenobacter tibetensis]|uniref:BatA domain-containing protein n=1 Tax=Hymenobacter tibetensis TaxID=497967 RepID=A0ABY4CZG6_9BACT|nr:BatA domain-containing protein [Hymenobacter tibetensis]UOG75663.1 BatA domain-containing protein [Hymenobacter tibetensis]